MPPAAGKSLGPHFAARQRRFSWFYAAGTSRVFVVPFRWGFLVSALFGGPLGYAMELSKWFRGWFDPNAEIMRPVPPLALIPLAIIWFGIGEAGQIIWLFLAAL